jgi:uncharacterized cysteine cluster protein YcgN (CxxCxxCC family)
LADELLSVIASTLCYELIRKIVYKIQFHPPTTAYKVMAKGARNVNLSKPSVYFTYHQA